MRLVAYQPDIPQNLGALIRIAACFDIGLDVIHPCGFPLSHKDLKRAAMDYGRAENVRDHSSWQAFLDVAKAESARLLLLTTKADDAYVDVAFTPADWLIIGRESAGAPEAVHAAVDKRVAIPMAAGARSLNMAVAGAVVAAEALRQTRWTK